MSANMMSEFMRQFSETIEPWFSEISESLIRDVEGFIEFLFVKLREMDIDTTAKQEIEEKLTQLLQWKNVAKKVLPEQSIGQNFVDSFALPMEPFSIIKSGNKCVFVLMETRNTATSEESKFESEIASGFVFGKCLRRVHNRSEFREVYKAVRCEIDLSTSEIVSVFEEDKYIIKRVGKDNRRQLYNDRLRREFKVQKLLTEVDHEGINKLVVYSEDMESMFAISESAGDKDLLDSLQDHQQFYGNTFCEERIMKLFKSAVDGFLVAHNIGIAHRDISLENLVVNSNLKREKMEIIDWGHSCSTSTRVAPNPGTLGKERYFAPELLSGEEFYDPFKADVFALGVCLFSAFTGQMPFANITDDRAALLKNGAEELLRILGKDKVLSPEAVDLLNICLKWDASERATMKEVASHSFFQK